MEITKSNINGLINTAIKINWEPDISDDALRILNKCDSTTEQLYLLGAAYCIEQIRDKYHGECSGQHLPIDVCKIHHDGNTYEGISFLSPWGAWIINTGGGPSACAFVPQMKFSNHNYHHDFGLFYGDSDGGGNWHFRCAIEIDTDVTHRDRKNKDAYRDALVSYDVIRINSDTHDFLSWFQLVIDRDEEIFFKDIQLSEEDNLPF